MYVVEKGDVCSSSIVMRAAEKCGGVDTGPGDVALGDHVRGLCHVRRPVGQDGAMKKPKTLHHGHRFPPSVVSVAVRWCFRFQLGLRDIEELLFEHGVIVRYETIRR